MDKELENWNPLIAIPFKQENVEETIRDFGKVVDEIKSRDFKTPSVEKLKSAIPGKKYTFAIQVCHNCDARFSYSAYRFNIKSSAAKSDSILKLFLNDFGNDLEREDWRFSNLALIPLSEDLEI